MFLTTDEKTFIIENHKVFNSYTILSRKFKSQFRKRQAPTKQTVVNLIKKFRKTGSVANIPSTGHPKTAITDEMIDEVSNGLKNLPGISIRRVQMGLPISYGSVYTIARGILQLFPYKIKILHQLKPLDFEKRIKFANWFLSVENIENIFVASDEAYFHMNGAVNNHNFRIWSDSKPEMAIEQPLRPDKVLVWCAVCSSRVVGPFFFDGTVNNERYLQMLKTFFGHAFTDKK